MMQSANFRELDHWSFRRRLNASCHRRVLLQREMGAPPRGNPRHGQGAAYDHASSRPYHGSAAL